MGWSTEDKGLTITCITRNITMCSVGESLCIFVHSKNSEWLVL